MNDRVSSPNVDDLWQECLRRAAGRSSRCRWRLVVGLLFALGSALTQAPLHAESVSVRHKEGTSHGFVVLRSVDGKILASGDAIQTIRGDRVTSQLTLHFKDGSVHEETTEFSQGAVFRLVSDHLKQQGRSFPEPVDAHIDMANGVVSVREKEGEPHESHLQLPEDVANGLLITILKNLPEADRDTTVQLVTTAAKPRIVKFTIRPQGAAQFSAGGSAHEALHFVGHTDIGGLAGGVAHLLGKQPPDVNFWVVGGKAPAFVRYLGPLYEGGPVWSIELAAPQLVGKASEKVAER
jgi:hypothetical protein